MGAHLVPAPPEPLLSGAANLAALPAAASNRNVIAKTTDGGVYISDGSAWQQISPPTGTYASLVGTTAQGLHKWNTASNTYGDIITVGNQAGSVGFAGTGSPAEGFGAFVVYQKFGDSTGGTNAPVTKTTQAMYVLANYYGPTSDDSAEGFSAFVGVKDTSGQGGAAFAQTKPITAIEGIAQIEGANTALTGNTAPLLAGGFRTNVLGTSHVATAAGVKVTHNTSGGPPYGTTDTYFGFWQPTASGATTAYGVYTVDKIASETGLTLGASGNTGSFSALLNGNSDSNTSMLLVTGPAAVPGLAQALLKAGTGQTKPILALQDSGGTSRFQWASSGFLTVTGSGININTSGAVNKIALASTGLTITDVDIILSSATGTKIGTATNQLLGFWGKTPVARQTLPGAGVVTADDIRGLLITMGLAQ